MERGDIVSCSDLDSSIGARDCVYEGNMVALLALVYNIGNIWLMGVFNGIRGRLGCSNDNIYSNPAQNKVLFEFSFLYSCL